MNPRILIVDDERILLNALKRAFQTEGFNVTAVESGAAAIAAIQNQAEAFSAALVDLLMPDMTGTELMKWLNENSPETYLVAMSALMDNATIMSLKHHGVQEFLVKPLEDVFEAPKTVLRALRCAEDPRGKDRS